MVDNLIIVKTNILITDIDQVMTNEMSAITRKCKTLKTNCQTFYFNFLVSKEIKNIKHNLKTKLHKYALTK